MSVRFILLMPWGRVGSNLLFAILRQAGRLKLVNENLIQVRTAAEQSAWFNDFYEIGKIPSRPHIGSKQNLRSIRDRQAFMQDVNQHELRIVRLRRENLVKAAVSQIRAELYAQKTARETGTAQWAVKKGADVLGCVPIAPALLLGRIKVMHQWDQILMDEIRGPCMLDIEYEEINSTFERVVKDLRVFLDFPQAPFAVPFVKATSSKLEEAISNFAEVHDALKGTQYAAQLLAQ